MSKGLPEDWDNTAEQLKNPNPCKDGRTWLRHGENKQSGKIDVMVLEGRYSVSEIADELAKLELFDNDKPLNYRIRRVKDHLLHLQDGESRGQASGTEPHKLKIIDW